MKLKWKIVEVLTKDDINSIIFSINMGFILDAVPGIFDFNNNKISNTWQIISRYADSFSV